MQSPSLLPTCVRVRVHVCVCALFISYTHLFVLDSHQVYLLLFLSLSDLREYSGELLSIVKENVLFIGEFTWEFLWQ